MSPPDLSLPEQIAQAMQNISVLEDKLRALGDELSGCQSQREQYQSIEAVCTSLEKLSKTEAAKLFREATGQDSQQQLQQMRGLVSGFQKKILPTLSSNATCCKLTLKSSSHGLNS